MSLLVNRLRGKYADDCYRWLRKTGAFDKKNQAAKAEREAKTESANEAKSSSTEREV